MRYKIYCSTEYGDYDIFYVDDKRQAHLLYNMAVECGFFDYVSISKVVDEEFIEKDWCSKEIERCD